MTAIHREITTLDLEWNRGRLIFCGASSLADSCALGASFRRPLRRDRP
jgi:hypothetical protein